MTDINPGEPQRDTRRMLVIVSVALAVIVAVLIVFVIERGGADGTLPGMNPVNRENPGAGGGGSVPAGSNPGGSPGSRPDGGR